MKIPAENTAKAVVYQKNADDSYIVAFIRGDLDINETKLTNVVGEDIHPAVIEDDSILTAGFIGPVGISDKVTVYFDNSLEGIDYLVTGANKVDTHYTGFNVERDCPDAKYVDLAKSQKEVFVQTVASLLLIFQEVLKLVISSNLVQNIQRQ